MIIQEKLEIQNYIVGRRRRRRRRRRRQPFRDWR
jgi:hypothetical protein